MAFTLFNSLQSQILPPLNALVNKSSDIISWVTPLFVLGITILLMIYGLDIMRGAGGQQYVTEAFLRITRPFLVLNLALVGGMYSSTVVGFFNDLRNGLTGLFGAQGSNSYSAIDGVMDQTLQTLANMVVLADQQISFVPANFQGVLIYACMAVIGLAMSLYSIVVVLNLFIIDAGLAIIFALGPLFVASFAFQATARFFDSWLSAVLKYTITATIITMILGLTNGLIQRFASKLATINELGDFMGVAAATLCTAALLLGLLYRAGILAGELTGGIAIQLSGMAAAQSAVVGAGAKAASTAGNAMAYVGGAAAAGITRAAGAASQTNLGVRVMQQTESMRSRASEAAGGAKNFAQAVSPGSTPSQAYAAGQHAATKSPTGTGTISGGRPVPKAK